MIQVGARELVYQLHWSTQWISNPNSPKPEPDEQYHEKDYAQGRYIPCISRNIEGQPSFRLTEYLIKHPVNPDSIVYLCGNRNMIIDAFETLREQGVPGDNLFTEVFF